MRVEFRATGALFRAVREDLRRPHPFAHERVGFIAAGLAAAEDDLLVLARDYRPVADNDYLPDPSVGAMMGPEALRKALQWALRDKIALFHVHTHGGKGIPGFSDIDLRENAKFVPDFFKVAPQCAHGALVLSDTAARGQVWLQRGSSDLPIDTFRVVGMPLLKWEVPA